MQRPKLRPLETFPVNHRGESMFLLRDPVGLSEHCAVVPRAAVALLSLCDGQRTLGEVAAEFQARTGHSVETARIRGLVEQLDEALLLDSPRFEAHRREVERRFLGERARPAAHAGESYPDEAAPLAEYLDSQSVRQSGPGAPPARRSKHDEVRALISPHIDFNRGGGAYAHAWRPLSEARARPDVVIVFGTDHNGISEPFTLTAKSYQTPLGLVPTDEGVVSRLAKALGPRLFAEELHHRREHSIEFQAVWLRHVYGDDCPPIVPILTGTLIGHISDGTDPAADPDLTRFIAALAENLAGKRVLVVAGADLAHVGPHFGDARDFGRKERNQVQRADHTSMEAAARGDAAGFFSSIAAIDDAHRVCGLSPIWASLRLLDALGGPRPRGELTAYDQCCADERDASFVSIASMVIR